MKLKFSLPLLLFILLTAVSSFSQMKVVIMGSSTAYGTGASVYDSSWVGRLTAFLNRNTSDGVDTVINNIANSGYDSYQEMPDDFVPPAGRPLPDQDYNVTKALSFTPDVVIINLPSNDLSYGYLKSETMYNFRLMFSRITASGARCYLTTPQPRNDFDADMRDSLFSMVDSVQMAFGAYSLDFWNGLVTTDGTYSLKDEYRAIPSPIHVNDDGHNLLFQKVINSYIFGQQGPVALQLTNLNVLAQNNVVLIRWHTEQQAANTSFEVQRSVDGNIFETAFTQSVQEARQSYNYSGTDQTPFSGKSFYRIKVTEPGRQTYSPVVSISRPGKNLDISNIYTTGSEISADLTLQKSQLVYIKILNAAGSVVVQQKQFINVPGTRITIPFGKFSSGQYYLHLVTDDGGSVVKPFSK